MHGPHDIDSFLYLVSDEVACLVTWFRAVGLFLRVEDAGLKLNQVKTMGITSK